jgi:N-acetylmuramic acid 6-phosphate etherase
MTSNYYQCTQNDQILRDARKMADRFVSEEDQFHLGYLPTEQAHPYTRNFSHTVQLDPLAGIRLLQKVDGDLPPVARRTFYSDSYERLVEAFASVVSGKGRLCFSGCGSTGRLAVMLEEMWRQYWEDRAGALPGEAAQHSEIDNPFLQKANQCCSVMTGGDRALIRAVENFEDFATFGRRQIAELHFSRGDVLIAITEGGETSSVLGTAEEALDRGGNVFLVFSNPSSLLESRIDRSRKLIKHPDLHVIDLFSGPMALSGSTRMQATTLEMMVVGSAMEEALLTAGEGHKEFDRMGQADRFASLLQSLESQACGEAMAYWAGKECQIYKEGGRVTYLASRFLLDIFCDTSERSPTFMLPPFRPADDESAPVSWAYAKDPRRTSAEAWFSMLRRKPRGLDWSGDDYKAMDAPPYLCKEPPSLGTGEIARYLIGCEHDPSRKEREPYWFLQIVIGDENPDTPWNGDLLRIGSKRSYKGGEEVLLPMSLPDSPIFLWHHLVVKLVLNTVSTATMGILGRIQGNWMVQLDPTNKKLIDRGSRIISQLTGIPYAEACNELHLSMLARDQFLKEGGQTTTSPVIDALERLHGII